MMRPLQARELALLPQGWKALPFGECPGLGSGTSRESGIQTVGHGYYFQN